jgi:hypothetical protein
MGSRRRDEGHSLSEVVTCPGVVFASRRCLAKLVSGHEQGYRSRDACMTRNRGNNTVVSAAAFVLLSIADSLNLCGDL